MAAIAPQARMELAIPRQSARVMVGHLQEHVRVGSVYVAPLMAIVGGQHHITTLISKAHQKIPPLAHFLCVKQSRTSVRSDWALTILTSPNHQQIIRAIITLMEEPNVSKPNLQPLLTAHNLQPSVVQTQGIT